MPGRRSLLLLTLPILACDWTPGQAETSPELLPSLSLSAGWLGRLGTLTCKDAASAELYGDALSVAWNETMPESLRVAIANNWTSSDCIAQNLRASDDSPDERPGPSEPVCDPPTTTTKADLLVPHYHGAGTYELETTEPATGPHYPFMFFTAFEDLNLHTVPARPGIPVTRCTLVVREPRTTQEGSLIPAHIRCTDMNTADWLNPASAPGKTASVQGDMFFPIPRKVY